MQLVPGECYHVYNRGTDKRTIYLDESDHVRFTELLYVCNSQKTVSVREIHREYESVYEYERGEALVTIGAYCLMPNHFHILIKPNIEKGLSMYMNKLTTGYSMYFNKKYQRSGALFQGAFKSEHANNDQYLKYLYAYIHLNPVKLIDSNWKEQGSEDAAKSFNFAASFRYSSLPDYLGVVRPENIIIDPAPFPEYFKTADDARAELFDWLAIDSTKLSFRGRSSEREFRSGKAG
jgi:putative transposase